MLIKTQKKNKAKMYPLATILTKQAYQVNKGFIIHKL